MKSQLNGNRGSIPSPSFPHSRMGDKLVAIGGGLLSKLVKVSLVARRQ